MIIPPVINGINDYMILSISLSSACIASVFFWNYPKNKTIMDKSCAWIYFVLLYHSLILLNKYI